MDEICAVETFVRCWLLSANSDGLSAIEWMGGAFGSCVCVVSIGGSVVETFAWLALKEKLPRDSDTSVDVGRAVVEAFVWLALKNETKSSKRTDAGGGGAAGVLKVLIKH